MYNRPVVRGVAGVARATPTFGGNRLKSIVVPPQLFGEKRHKAHQILVPPHLKIPTYGPVIYLVPTYLLMYGL